MGNAGIRRSPLGQISLAIGRYSDAVDVTYHFSLMTSGHQTDKETAMAAPGVGERIERQLSLDLAAIRAGANLVGDFNPLHHDEAFAAASRFRGIIASGAHTSALLAGLASGLGRESVDGRGNVGVDYSIQFLAPAHAGHPLHMEWRVVSTEPKSSGTIARLEGKIVDTSDGTLVLAGKMTVFYFG